MRRIMISLLVSLLLLCSVVGLKNLAAQQTGGTTPVVLASGGYPPPPIPE